MPIRNRQAHGLSLVPLADLLAGLVGVFLFVAIFTVLVTGQAVVSKVFPKEKTSNAEPISLLCEKDVVYLEDIGEAVDLFRTEAAEPLKGPSSYQDVGPWRRRLTSVTVESDFFDVKSEVSITEGNNTKSIDFISANVSARRGAYETMQNQFSDHAILAFLETSDPTERFVYFIVEPDCIDTFLETRELASAAGFEVGWSPHGGEDAIKYTLFMNENLRGSGIEQKPQ